MPANVKLLLVDDNPMVLEMLRQGLAPLANVQTANDGADAMLKAIDDLPDLIVSDYDMPGMSGRQLLEKIKGRAATAKVPIILLASRADISEKLKMVQDNVEDFIEKPFTPRKPAVTSRKSSTRSRWRRWRARRPAKARCVVRSRR